MVDRPRPRSLRPMSAFSALRSQLAKRLPFRSFPVHLKIVTAVLGLFSVLRLGHWGYCWLTGVERPRGIGSAILVAIGASDLIQGKREGLVWIGGVTAFLGAVMLYALAIGEPMGGAMFGILAYTFGLTAYLAWCWWSVPWKEAGSFGEWLTDPDARGSAEEWFEVRDRLVARDAVARPDPDALVAELLDEDQLALHRLRALRETEPVQQALERALAEPRFQRSEFAAEHIVELIDSERIGANRRLIGQVLDEVPESAREGLVGAIAARGDETFSDVIVGELERDENPWRVARGLAEAARAGRASAGFVRAVSPALWQRVGAAVGGDSCAIALARCDPKNVETMLARARELDPAMVGAICNIAEDGVAVDQDRWNEITEAALAGGKWFLAYRLLPRSVLAEDRLDHWLEEVPKHLGETDPDGRSAAAMAYGALLRRAASQRGAAAEPLLREAAASDRERVCDQAAQGLLELAGIPENYRWQLDRSSPVLRPLRAAHELYWRTRNDGFFGAVIDSDGDAVAAWPEMLQHIAPQPVRAIVQEVIAQVAGGGPLPRSRRARQKLVAERHDRISATIDQLDKRFFAVDHTLAVAMDLYAIENRVQVLDSIGELEEPR